MINSRNRIHMWMNLDPVEKFRSLDPKTEAFRRTCGLMPTPWDLISDGADMPECYGSSRLF